MILIGGYFTVLNTDNQVIATKSLSGWSQTNNAAWLSRIIHLLNFLFKNLWTTVKSHASVSCRMTGRMIYWVGKGPYKRTQHCWMLNVASIWTPCCVLLGVVASVCALLQTRTQQIPTSLDQQCWKLSCPLQIAKIWGRRWRQKRRLKREFAFLQSSSWFPPVTYFIKCRRTLLELNF